MINMDIEIKRSNRKTMSIEVTKEASLLVRAPYWISLSEIHNFVQEKSDWIEKHVQKVRERQAMKTKEDFFTPEQLQELAMQAWEQIPERVQYFAQKINVSYGRITIRNQRTRWGSCSSKGNLNFNCLLMLTPREVQDYVIVHELCHRKEMNHSKQFWQEVENILPDYKEWRKWLKDKGGELISRIG